jgi:hypothetical protein
MAVNKKETKTKVEKKTVTSKPKEINKVEETKETVTEKKKSLSEIRKELKKQARDIDIEIMNISNGGVIYQRGNVYIDLDNIGDTTIISLEELMTLKGKDLLDKLFISIVDVYSSEFELKDIIDVLGLDKSYKYCDMTIDGLDEFIEGTNTQDFEDILNGADNKFVSRVIERSVFLSKNDGFDSTYKRNILEEKANNRFLFNVI